MVEYILHPAFHLSKNEQIPFEPKTFPLSGLRLKIVTNFVSSYKKKSQKLSLVTVKIYKIM